MSAVLPEIGATVAGRYRLSAVEGAGMMGVVFRAVDAADGTEVALKVLRPEVLGIEGVASRLEREGQIVSGLQSPHLVRIIEVGHTAGGLPFVAMELLVGQELALLLETRGTLPVTVAVQYVRQACVALALAHDAGVVHRDLKPENLFVVRDAQGRDLVKVLDFGVSKLFGADADLTVADASLGTPLYMSPEQVRSARDVDERSDVWALGVILYELLCGRTPFECDSASAAAAAIVADEPRALVSLRPDVPLGLSRVVGEALVKDRHKRIRSVRALAEALLPYETEVASASTASATGARLGSPSSPAHGAPSRGPLDRAVPGPAAPKRLGSKNLVLGVVAGLLLATLLLGLGIALWRRSRGDTRPLATSLGISRGQTFGDLLAAPASEVAGQGDCLLSGNAGSFALAHRLAPEAGPLGNLDLSGDPRFLVATPWVEPLAVRADGAALHLVAATPLFSALRRGPLAIVVVTATSQHVAVAGAPLLARDVAPAELSVSLDLHVPGAPGVLVAVDSAAPVERLALVLDALDGARRRLVLATVHASEPERERPAALPYACSVRPLPGAPLSGNARSELMGEFDRVEKSCAESFPEAAGTTLRGLARVSEAGRVEVCVTGEELPSVRLRNCVVGEVQKRKLTQSGEARMLAYSLSFDLPRALRGRCTP